jgi:hypothetical protein
MGSLPVPETPSFIGRQASAVEPGAVSAQLRETTVLTYIHTEGPMYKSYFWLGCRLVEKRKRVCVYLRGDSKKGTSLTSMVNRLYKFRNCHGKTSTGSSTYIHAYHRGIDSTTKVLSQFLPRYLFLTAKGLSRSGNTRPHHIPNSELSILGQR